LKEKNVHEVPVGRLPPSLYAAQCLAAFIDGYGTVVLKARGRRISDAVTVSQMVVRAAPHVRVAKVDIGTEQRVSKNGKTGNVSTMLITLEASQPRQKPPKQGRT
jgi:DNA-binding protein Alba